MFVTRISLYIQRSVLSAVSRYRGRSWDVLPVDTGAHLYCGQPRSGGFPDFGLDVELKAIQSVK
jgi:hypothetical protein